MTVSVPSVKFINFEEIVELVASVPRVKVTSTAKSSDSPVAWQSAITREAFGLNGPELALLPNCNCVL